MSDKKFDTVIVESLVVFVWK